LGSLNRTSRSCGITSRTAWARSSPTRSFDARLVQREKGYPLGPLGFSSLNSTTWNSPGFAWSSPVFANPVAIPCLPQGPMMAFRSCLVLQLSLIMSLRSHLDRYCMHRAMTADPLATASRSRSPHIDRQPMTVIAFLSPTWLATTYSSSSSTSYPTD
jgi:hypothetical protein